MLVVWWYEDGWLLDRTLDGVDTRADAAMNEIVRMLEVQGGMVRRSQVEGHPV